ncbi:MAG TPA: 30S ribosomal protein S18 [Candidatus Limnocylindria bacterium]|nr:30S ribosomal protein S18 [Candidatus Limnocylindria bacterium]
MTAETPQPQGPRPGGYASRGPRPGGPGGARDGGGDRPRYGGPRRPRRKVCSFCVEKVQRIDYKDVGRIRRYLSDRGKIDPRRKSGSCSKHQRMLTIALKRARLMALLPYTAEHVRAMMSPQARAMAGGPPPPKPERPPYRPGGAPMGGMPFRPAGAPAAPAAQAPQPAAAPPAQPPQGGSTA